MSLIISKPDIQRFVMGGNALFTIENRFSGGRFTYKVRQKRAGDIYWVSLLNGPNNTSDFRYFGTIFPPEGSSKAPHFKHSAKGKIGIDAPSAKAWQWFFTRLFNAQDFPLGFEFHHSGRCGRCGRTLSTPESCRRGIGPECAQMLSWEAA